MKILHTGQEHRHLFMYLTWWEGAYLRSILSKCEVTKSNQPGNLNEVWTAGEASPLASPIVHAVNEHFTVQTRNAHAHRATSHGGTAQDSLPNHKGVSHVEKTSMPSSVQDHQTCTADTSSNKNSHNCCWIAGQKKHIQISNHHIFISNGKGLWWMHILATQATASNGLSSSPVTQLPSWLDNPDFIEAHGSLWPNQALNMHM